MNNNRTYIAYDAAGILNPERSNYHVLQWLEALQKRFPNRFHFVNLDDIMFSSRHDDLVDSTMKSRMLQLMAQADNMLVIPSDRLNTESLILNWQISRCINRFHLPFIVAYAGLEHFDEGDVQKYWNWLPVKIKKYINTDTARMAHIPCTIDKLERALGYFSLRTRTYPWHTTTIY